MDTSNSIDIFECDNDYEYIKFDGCNVKYKADTKHYAFYDETTLREKTSAFTNFNNQHYCQYDHIEHCNNDSHCIWDDSSVPNCKLNTFPRYVANNDATDCDEISASSLDTTLISKYYNLGSRRRSLSMIHDGHYGDDYPITYDWGEQKEYPDNVARKTAFCKNSQNKKFIDASWNPMKDANIEGFNPSIDRVQEIPNKDLSNLNDTETYKYNNDPMNYKITKRNDNEILLQSGYHGTSDATVDIDGNSFKYRNIEDSDLLNKFNNLQDKYYNTYDRSDWQLLRWQIYNYNRLSTICGQDKYIKINNIPDSNDFNTECQNCTNDLSHIETNNENSSQYTNLFEVNSLYSGLCEKKTENGITYYDCGLPNISSTSSSSSLIPIKKPPDPDPSSGETSRDTIDYDYNIVCFNIDNWIGNSFTIPSGPLRENIKNLKKYKNVFLNGNNENIDNIIKYIHNLDPNINIYQGEYVPLNINEFDKSEKYLVFSGIGNHKTFISMLRKNNINIVKEIEFPDHYRYLQKEIDDIISMSEKLNCKVMTTEKDYMRLNNNDKIFYIKSELKILNQETFINDISKVYENN